MIQQMQVRCPECDGTGNTIKPSDQCKTCKGKKVSKKKETLEVFVTKGMKHGEKIKFDSKADEAPDTIPGDVIVVLQQKEHELFKRVGPNLLMKKEITLYEALCGCKFDVEHLDGRQLLIRSGAEVIKPGDYKAIPNEGMPSKRNPFVRGLLIIEFSIVFPDKQPNAKFKKQLKGILPQPTADDIVLDEDHEEVQLVDVDIEEEMKKRHERGGRSAYDSDDEDEEGGPRMGCRSQ
jgi:DnaJ family protein A protein 2